MLPPSDRRRFRHYLFVRSLARASDLFTLSAILRDWDGSRLARSMNVSIGHTYTLFIAFVQEDLVAMLIEGNRERGEREEREREGERAREESESVSRMIARRRHRKTRTLDLYFLRIIDGGGDVCTAANASDFCAHLLARLRFCPGDGYSSEGKPEKTV